MALVVVPFYGILCNFLLCIGHQSKYMRFAKGISYTVQRIIFKCIWSIFVRRIDIHTIILTQKQLHNF